MSSLLFAQTPELVIDYNAGSEDSFSEWSDQGIVINDDIYLPIVGSAIGEELAIIRNGVLSIVKDINEGEVGSEPRDFFLYKDELYFVADDGINGDAIWKTDGTEEGTEMLFDVGDDQFWSSSLFIEANNGWLYYSYSGSVYRTDGEVNEEVFADLGFNSISSGFITIGNFTSTNHCKYKDGVAFIQENSGNIYSLLYIDGNEVVELARTENVGGSADVYGLHPVINGLTFNVGDSDLEAVYHFSEDNQELSRLEIDGFFAPARRTIDFSDELNICVIQGEGTYAINGVEGEEEEIFSSGDAGWNAGFPIVYGQYEDKLAFLYKEGTFGDDYLIYTDGTSNGTSSQVIESDQSNMVVSDNFGFFADGVDSNAEPRIYKLDFNTGEIEMIYEYTGSDNFITIRLLSVYDGYLYFISDLDGDVGAELYKIEAKIMVDVEDELLIEELTLTQAGNQFTVNTNSRLDIEVHVYNTLGQKLLSNKVQNKKSFDINLNDGCYFMNIRNGKNTLSKVVYISK